jgi:spore maturation protein CgeB
VWHEAADTRRFQPPAEEHAREGLVWVGNWGDGERSQEIVDYLLEPAQAAGLELDIYGVRYPTEARQTLQSFGAHYHGWIANAAVPDVFATHLATVHVPRRFYTQVLPGIPTIRVFEALACGIPLVSAPWDDCEQLFRVGEDFLMVRDGAEMTRVLPNLKADSDLRASLAQRGLETIRARHTCAHRVDELLNILERLGAPVLESAA